MQLPTPLNPDKKPSRPLLRGLVGFGLALLIGLSPLPPIVKDGLLSILRQAGLGVTSSQPPREIIVPAVEPPPARP